jgi:hypothetical protein
VEVQETCPLPDYPVLAEMALAMREAGHWAEIVDASWRLVYMTDDLRLGFGGMLERVNVPLGVHPFGPESVSAREQWRTGPTALDVTRQALAQLGPLVLADTPGGHEELRGFVDPRLGDVVDALRPTD